jgi:SAM-dependent methyltransferase
MRHISTERMFGFGGRFEYFECDACGCVQLLTPPADLARYYPATYYSFQELEGPDLLPVPGWRRRLFQARNQAQFFGGPGAMLATWRRRADFDWVRPLLRHTTVRRLDARILDVGCGSGRLLKRLRQAGFTRLVGCDPFLSAPIEQPPELTIHACSIEALVPREAGRFDLVMFHHSLEHMPEPLAPLRAAAALLTPSGRCLVGIPVASSEAWHAYGIDWVELDPPRHFFLHTTRSFAVVARAAGLRVDQVEQDGGSFEFWGSELYRRGMTLMGPDGRVRHPRDVFTTEECEAFERRAVRANADGRGGRALFFCALDVAKEHDG